MVSTTSVYKVSDTVWEEYTTWQTESIHFTTSSTPLLRNKTVNTIYHHQSTTNHFAVAQNRRSFLDQTSKKNSHPCKSGQITTSGQRKQSPPLSHIPINNKSKLPISVTCTTPSHETTVQYRSLSYTVTRSSCHWNTTQHMMSLAS